MKIKIDAATQRIIDMLSGQGRQSIATMIMGLFEKLTPEEQDWLFIHYFDVIKKDKS